MSMPINEYKNKGYMKTFKDLEFKPHAADKNGVQATIEFENGWGASVVQFDGSYGGQSGLFELAVLKDGFVDMNNDITDDVIGWLDESDVTKVLKQIQELA